MSVGAYALTTLAAVKACLSITGTTEDALIESLIDRVSDRADAYCGRYLIKRTYTGDVYDGSGSRYLLLNHWPIISVATVVEDDVTLTATTDYEIAGQGMLYRVDGVWSTAEPRNVAVTYTAGYVLNPVTPEVRDLPFALEDAIIKQIVKAHSDLKHKTLGVTSRSMPDGSQSFFETSEWLKEVRETLDRYREVPCG